MSSSRTALTDGSNRWFDEEKSISFTEDAEWDGSNMISKATGSQYDHQKLHYTKGGTWVLYRYSQWQGSMASYTAIDEEDAVQWLIAQSCMDSAEINYLPMSVQEAVESSIEAAEL